MKREVVLDVANRLINSGNLVLITSADGDKKNICPVAWHMPISKYPFYIGIAVAKEHYTSELIMVSEEFTINVPTWDILDKVKLSASKSGKEVDKFELAGLTPESPMKLSEAPRIKECVAAIECELYQTVELGDHNMFIGQAVWVEVEEELFTDNCWDTSKVKLIYHLGGKYFCKPQERELIE